MTYFHENFEEIFSEFWRNSLKIRGKNEKIVRNLKIKNKNYSFVLVVYLVTDEKKIKK